MPCLKPLALAAILASILALPAAADDVVKLTVTRAATLPKLTYTDVTLSVDAAGAAKAKVTADGKPVESRLEKDHVIFTTTGANVAVTLSGVTDKSRLGKFAKAALKDDKLWAFSAGFDDNASFKSTAIPLLEKYDYRGTVFLIGSNVNETRNEGWIIDQPDIMRLVKKGWGIGNHTWKHTTVPVPPEKGASPTAENIESAKESVRQTYKMLRAACDKAGRTDYRLIAFAAPMFDGRWQPVIDDMIKKSDSEVLFNESGNRYFVCVDPGFKPKNPWVSPAAYTLTGSIGRDPNIEAFGTGSKSDPKEKLVSEIAKCNETYHLWYNVLCHGVPEKHGFMKFVPFVAETYGKAGNNSVWVAPADEIFSYLLVRDNTTVTLGTAK